MIRVERPDGPSVLVDEDGKGAEETRDAIASFEAHLAAHPDKPDEWSFSFKIYKHADVKAALEAIFHGKCAYCESQYRGTQPMDVEHWRPKGRTIPAEGAAPLKPAYYWLAADWENLLPSCIDCNRKRKQHDVVEGRTVSIGKKDEFPLREPASRATAPPAEGEEVPEVPLLLNPCTDDPAEFLDFDPDGRGVLRSRQASEPEKKRANESIRVYGLNRVGLVLNRQEHARRLELRIATIKALARVLTEHDLPDDDPIGHIIEERLVAEMRALAHARRDDQPFALLSRNLIDHHMADFEDPTEDTP